MSLADATGVTSSFSWSQQQMHWQLADWLHSSWWTDDRLTIKTRGHGHKKISIEQVRRRPVESEVTMKNDKKDQQNISDCWNGATNKWRSGSWLSEPPQFGSDDCASTIYFDGWQFDGTSHSSRHNLDVELTLRCSIAYWLLFCLSSNHDFDASINQTIRSWLDDLMIHF